MRNLEETIMRMLILSEHLNSQSMQEKYSGTMPLYFSKRGMALLSWNDKQYPLFPCCAEELVNLFSEWTKSEEGRIYYKPAHGLCHPYALQEFMGLDQSELLHCFSVDRQKIELYGGRKLTLASKPCDIAKNIEDLLLLVLEKQKLKRKK